MPLYEYRCEDCGSLTETIRRMSDADETMACEACGSLATRRVTSVFTAKSGAARARSSPGPCGPGGCPCALPDGGCGLQN
ncbi:MAG: zinc ribbon domain-containing protein [Planctomycetota bacterium]